MELFEWMTSTTWGESLLTLLVSMVPVIELRGGVPFGTALGLAPLHALVVCIIGNMLPIPFIIVYIRRIFHWMRRRSPRLNALVDKLEKKGTRCSSRSRKILSPSQMFLFSNSCL